ncbi:MAG: hypothetical protein JWR10_2446 [Rubritepida sp.]|nr:hypothetical protein [Rubritepida sp.]
MSDEATDHAAQLAAHLAAIDWEASIETFHALAKETQNPIYAWHALEARFKGKLGAGFEKDIGGEFTIPGWVAEYLLAVMLNVLDLAAGIDPRIEKSGADPGEATKPSVAQYRTPEEILQSPEWKAHMESVSISPNDAMKLLPMVLGLTRRGGWNAFSAFKASTAKMHEANSYDAMREGGVPSKIALHAISSVIGVGDPSHMSRRIRDGRQLVKRAKAAKRPG